jgi:hypothetical protein
MAIKKAHSARTRVRMCVAFEAQRLRLRLGLDHHDTSSLKQIPLLHLSPAQANVCS